MQNDFLDDGLIRNKRESAKKRGITVIVLIALVVVVAIAVGLVLGMVVYKPGNSDSSDKAQEGNLPNPSNPSDPANPSNPSDPANPSNPSNPSNPLDPQVPADPTTTPAPVAPLRGFALPEVPASEGRLLVVEDTANLRPDGSRRVVARNSGNGWETIPDADNVPVDIACRAEGCVIRTEGADNQPSGRSLARRAAQKSVYAIREMRVPEHVKAVSNKARAARLLTQATFGGTLAEIEETASKYGKDFLGWIKDQMKIEPTSLTSHYRKRTSPRRTGNADDGIIFSHCDVGSRWHRQVISRRDVEKKLRVSKSNNRFVLEVDGVRRGDTDTFMGKKTSETVPDVNFPADFNICEISRQESIGGNVEINAGNCVRNRNMRWTNPEIEFSSNRPSNLLTVTDAEASFDGIVADAYMLRSLTKNCDRTKNPNTAYMRLNGKYYRHDPRLHLIENTLASPADVSNIFNATCPAVEKSFLNEDFCVRRPSCSKQTIESAPLPLAEANLKFWFEKNQRYVYYVTGLELKGAYLKSPCNSGQSRWQKIGTSGSCPGGETALDGNTMSYIRGELLKSTDQNAFVRDVTLADTKCDASNTNTTGAKILVRQQCYQHVHPHTYDVYDATSWRDKHPGGKAAIAKWTSLGYNLVYPSRNHPMMRWADHRKDLFYVGRYGDTIDFKELPTELRTSEMAERVNALSPSLDFEVCGSPGESGGTTALGNLYRYGLTDRNNLDFGMPQFESKSTVWTNVVMKSPDQLRQRVAWTIANVVTMGDTVANRELIEIFTSFYDIFVRNAFGSYRDIMRQVSYHPMMGIYLSYRGNKKFAVSNTFPDENYAREIMQLYSVGLWKLNDDGTRQLDTEGNPVPTYTNEDIVDIARVWTGFDRKSRRPNIVRLEGNGYGNYIDMMKITHSWRDAFPKHRLDSGYIGDGYPLCNELPSTPWVRKGAVFKFSGPSSVEGKTIDDQKSNESGGWGRLEIVKGKSKLYNLLCAPGSNGRCTFPNKVVLRRNVACYGKECNAGRVISVKIVDPVAGVTRYYTYESTPCVGLTMFNEGKLVSRASTRKQCADPTTAVGTPVCCQSTRTNSYDGKSYGPECLFANEAMDYETAKSRCENQEGSVLCDGRYTSSSTEWRRTCVQHAYQWLDSDCRVRVQVYESGRVSLSDSASEGFKELGNSTNNVFRVRWFNDKYPQAADKKCPGSCTMLPSVNGDSCLCDTQVTESRVFLYAPRTVAQVESNLFIGALEPSSYAPQVRYELCDSDACKKIQDVKVWRVAGEAELSTRTIIEIPPFRAGGKTRYFFNKKSMVSVGSFSFRNPPHVMPLNGGLQDVGRDWFNYVPLSKAKLEVEMLLDHLFEHDTTAPFVAHKMIQHMVTSNPSPRYMKAVVNAFRTGTYRGETFSGKYGDLAATTAAILLDPEARNPVLEADPTFGMQRDPMMKIIQFMRSMEYKSTDQREIDISTTQGKIGVQAFRQPSVFGFYLPEFRPPGAISDAGLVSPASELATTPLLVSYVNGMLSLINNGLTYCSGGFGVRDGRGGGCGRSMRPDGQLSYMPRNVNVTSEVVEELDLLLTSGRMSAATKKFISDSYKANLEESDGATALKHALKQIVTSVEFQITGLNQRTTEAPEEPIKIESKGRPFKAVVIIFEGGGADSYNLVVPHSQCPARDMYAHYDEVRGGAAVDKDSLLQIDVSGQVCRKFGVHPTMTNLAKMYNDGDAAFLANIGALVEPVTVADVRRRSDVRKKLPPSLFSHNIMQRSAHNLHAQQSSAKGILGRIFRAMTSQASPFKTDVFSISGNQKSLDGANSRTIVDRRNGIRRFAETRAISEIVGNTTDVKIESLFGNHFAELLRDSFNSTEAIGAELGATTLETSFGTDSLSQQMEKVAELIKMRGFLESERQLFITTSGGWDTHSTFDLDNQFGGVDRALGTFATEMKAQGTWDDVVVLTVSDFGRTMTDNGRGTDHAWGGNHFVAGGSIKGKRMFGKYPEDLSDKGDLSLGRGRLVPTSAWESVWIGIAEWYGVTPEQLKEVLPNHSNFPEELLFRRNELFK